MDLAPGLRLAIAPRFHVRADWQTRLQINGGVEPKGNALLARSDWRELTEEELTQVMATSGAVGAGVAQLFNLPSHVAALWWEAAEAVDTAGGGASYERFVGQVVELLQFKQMPLPESCGFDVRVSQPGMRSTRLDARSGDAGGLAVSPIGDAGRRTLAWINLGDEATHVVMANIVETPLAFLAANPDYPLLRLRLESGEGLWFPTLAVAHDGDTVGKLDIDAVLTLSASP